MCLIAGLLVCLPLVSFGASYYVATNGNDGYTAAQATSLMTPWQTIQKAASVMVAGDTCYIRGGTYRQSITPANSGTVGFPITYRPYSNEVVTVSGADAVVGWSVYSNGIYKANFTGALGDKDQVFVDGVMMNLARWPNTSLDISRPVKAVADSASYATTNNPDGTRSGTYIDANLTQPAGYFVGAKIHLVTGAGVGWIAQTGNVTNYAPGAVTFRWNLISTASAYTPQAGNPYFLFGLLSLLDAPGEWFIDSTLNRMYLWPPQNDSPANHTVEAKKRDYGFELTGKSYITLLGLRLFACSVNSSSASKGLVLDGLECKYVSHFSQIEVASPASPWSYHTEDTGLILNGTNNILRNSHIAYSAGNGVTVLGASNLVDNCVIHDVDYADLDCAAINTGNSTTFSTGHEIRYNTCYNGGRGLVGIRSLTAGKVHHNVIYRSMLGTTDGGALYSFGHDGQNTEISYNRISDNLAAGNTASGIYLDNNSTNFIVHHNLIYNTSWGLHYNLNSINIKWFNNTALAFFYSFKGDFTGSQTNTEIRNNIFTAPYKIASTIPAEVAFSNNITNTVDPLFVLASSLDFRVQSNSPAVNAGIALPPYTDGFNGTAPDIGAFEFGQVSWGAGSTLTNVPPAGPTELNGIATGSGIVLTWKDNATNETQYTLERSVDNQVYTDLVTLPANTTNYTDYAVQSGTYYYRVRANESPNSNYRSVKAGINAYGVIQAEAFDAQSGLSVGTVIGSCDNNDWARYPAVDFGSGVTNINLWIASGATGTNNYVEVRLDSTSGTRIANINVLGTGGYGVYTNLTAAVTNATGIHDLFLVFKGGFGVCNLDYFSFVPAAPRFAYGTIQAESLDAQSGLNLGTVIGSCDNNDWSMYRAVNFDSGVSNINLWIASGAIGTNNYVEVRLDSTNGTLIANINVLGTGGYGVYTNLTAAVTNVTGIHDLFLVFKGGFGVCNLDYFSFVPAVFLLPKFSFAATVWTAQESWRYQYFGTNLSTGNAADNADPDGDGMVNLFEYAVNRNPTVPDAAGAFTASLDKSGKLQVTFFRARAELNYTVQVSDSLTGNWTDLITNPGSVGQNVTVTETPPGATQRFMRLRINPNP
jgi:hypothetical protein